MAETKTKKTTKEKVAKESSTVANAKVDKKTTKTVKPSTSSISGGSRKAEASVQLAEKPVTAKKGEKSSLTVSVYDTNGKAVDTIALPEEIFGVKVNAVLMAQAVRVYLANQRQGNASTKTRGEVTGSTRKIYRQKGTGRARHGGIRAPIFVHGGIAHGPKPQDHSLSLPKKMRKTALFSALATKMGELRVVTGLESLEPKTKVMAKALGHFGLSEKKAKVLLVMPNNDAVVTRAGRNLVGVTVTAADRLNTYEVLNAKSLVFMKESIARMEEVFGRKKDN